MTDLTLPRPFYSSSFKYNDIDINTIAEYLYNEINNTFYESLRYNIIKTYRSFNDVTIPLVDYPVLKVYRKSESDSIILAPQLYVDISIVYILAFNQKQKTADVSALVSREIRRLLKNASISNIFQLDESAGITVMYDTLIDPDNVVYRYCNVDCRVITFEE